MYSIFFDQALRWVGFGSILVYMCLVPAPDDA
jgi:hypothetical protein